MAKRKTGNKQLNARFDPEQMARIEEAAQKKFAGNKSILVRVAVLAWLAANSKEGKAA